MAPPLGELAKTKFLTERASGHGTPSPYSVIRYVLRNCHAVIQSLRSRREDPQGICSTVGDLSVDFINVRDDSVIQLIVHC